MDDEKNSFGPWDDGPWCYRCGTWHAINATSCVIVQEAQPITHESLIQDFGFKPVEGGMGQFHLTNGSLECYPRNRDGTGQITWYFPANARFSSGSNLNYALAPRTRGHLRRLLSLLADIHSVQPPLDGTR
jgi:hypothetical protein